MTIVAAFGERQYLFDMALALVFGVIGYIAHKTNYHVTAILIGIILGPVFEQYLVRSLRISEGDFSILFSSPAGERAVGAARAVARAARLAGLAAAQGARRRAVRRGAVKEKRPARRVPRGPVDRAGDQAFRM